MQSIWQACRSLPLLAPLPEAAREAFLERCRKETFADGEALFEEGAQVDGMHVVLSGVVKMTRLTPDGRELVIHLVRHGKLVGEGGVFLHGTAPLGGQAIGEVETLFIPSEEVFQLIGAYPEVAIRLLGGLCKRLRMFSHKIATEGQSNAVQRVASYLLHRNKIQRNGDDVLLDVPRDVLANLLGLARETLSRQMSRLGAAGAIACEGRVVHILNRAALEEAVRSGKEELG